MSRRQPPHTIISVPVHTAVAADRGPMGASGSTRHVPWAGSYAAPSPRTARTEPGPAETVAPTLHEVFLPVLVHVVVDGVGVWPPQKMASVPVHTAAGFSRAGMGGTGSFDHRKVACGWLAMTWLPPSRLMATAVPMRAT